MDEPFQNPILLAPPLPGTALLELIDKQLLVQLRDGRKIIGMFRSFDQFANLVLESSFDRIIVGEQYYDKQIGVQIIRGENVVILGEMEPNAPPPPGLTPVSYEDIKKAIKAEKEAARLKKTMMARMDFLDIE